MSERGGVAPDRARCSASGPSALSGGDLQRVAIGRALVRRPKALLMDEPIGALDAKLREDMRAELKRLHIENGTTSVYVTHDQVEAMSLADRVAVMNDGVLQQVGTPSEVYLQPGQPLRGAVRGLAGDEHHAGRGPGRGRRDRRVDRRRAGLRAFRASSAPRLGAALPAGHELVVGVRPEAVQVAHAGGPGLRPVEAQFIEPLGSHDIVDLKVGERFLKARTPSGFVRAPGEAVWARLDVRPGAFLRRHHRRRAGPGAGAWLRSGSMASASASSGSQALDGLTLTIADGEFFVLLGPTGAGKTTTLRLIAGLERPDAGHGHASAARTPPAGAWRSATWRWSSSTTRSTRATRCGRTWRFR